MNWTSSVRKQNSSGHFSPKSPDCLIRMEQKLVRSLSRSLTTEYTLTDQETFGMKSQKEGGSGPQRAVTPWRKKNFLTITLSRWPKNACCYITRTVTSHLQSNMERTCVLFCLMSCCIILMNAGCFSFLVILFSSLWMDSALCHCIV
jgi:hypothetical protein